MVCEQAHPVEPGKHPPHYHYLAIPTSSSPRKGKASRSIRQQQQRPPTFIRQPLEAAAAALTAKHQHQADNTNRCLPSITATTEPHSTSRNHHQRRSHNAPPCAWSRPFIPTTVTWPKQPRGALTTTSSTAT